MEVVAAIARRGIAPDSAVCAAKAWAVEHGANAFLGPPVPGFPYTWQAPVIKAAIAELRRKAKERTAGARELRVLKAALLTAEATRDVALRVLHDPMIDYRVKVVVELIVQCGLRKGDIDERFSLYKVARGYAAMVYGKTARRGDEPKLYLMEPQEVRFMDSVIRQGRLRPSLLHWYAGAAGRALVSASGRMYTAHDFRRIAAQRAQTLTEATARTFGWRAVSSTRSYVPIRAFNVLYTDVVQ
jgi:hypothetical protein